MAGDDALFASLGEVVTARPRSVALAFLIVTAAFGVGLTELSVSSDLDRYTKGTPEKAAMNAVEADFGGHGSDATSQLVYSGDELGAENVLAKPSLLKMVQIEQELGQRDGLHVESATSPATFVARALDPRAATPAEQQQVLQQATPAAVSAAVRDAADNPQFRRMLSEDFDAESASAGVARATVAHDFPTESVSDESIAETQHRVDEVVQGIDGGVIVWGSQILFDESDWAIQDSLGIVAPVVMTLLVAVLLVAYRDPIDVTLALLSLCMALVWTFGFAGFAGMPFDQLLLATSILLLALGIDFGIHVINRYREERGDGCDPGLAMAVGTRQLGVAFLVVTVTAVIGFGTNVTSDLQPIREYGIISSVGIASTFVVFQWFLPAAKLIVDGIRDRYPVPDFSSAPIGSEESRLGGVLTLGYQLGAKAPAVLVVLVLLASAFAGMAATDIEREYAVQDFLPPEEQPGYVDDLPESMEPREYTSPEVISLYDERFSTDPTERVVMYLQGDLTENGTLSAIQRAERDPPSAIAQAEGSAAGRGITDVIRRYARESADFAALVRANDVDGDGLPDRNLDTVYDRLFASPYGDQARAFLTEDANAARIDYAVQSDATREDIAADAETMAGRYPVEATATGDAIIFNTVDERMVDSAVVSLALAIVATGLFLVVAYWYIEGEALLGLVNMVPILVTVTLLGGTMALLDLPLNSLTATVFAVTIGVGVDYSVHITHRFVDELDGGEGRHEALLTTLRGTGGALTGSMLTTVSAMLALLLALSPILSQFGLLMAIGIAYSYLTSLIVLPAVIVLWERWAPTAARPQHSAPEV